MRYFLTLVFFVCFCLFFFLLCFENVCDNLLEMVPKRFEPKNGSALSQKMEARRQKRAQKKKSFFFLSEEEDTHTHNTFTSVTLYYTLSSFKNCLRGGAKTLLISSLSLFFLTSCFGDDDFEDEKMCAFVITVSLFLERD